MKEKVYELKKHIIDCTANLAVSTPLIAGLETFLAGMSDETSINARLITTGITYLGIGSLVSRGRDFYRKIFGITDKTKEKIQTVNDSIYFILFNLGLAPVIYYVSGTRDLKEITLGTLSCMGLGAMLGPPVGYTIDMFRDLTGIKESKRISLKIKKLKKGIKRGLVSLVIAGSILATSGVYYLTPEKKIEPKLDNQHNLETIIKE